MVNIVILQLTVKYVCICHECACVCVCVCACVRVSACIQAQLYTQEDCNLKMGCDVPKLLP